MKLKDSDLVTLSRLLDDALDLSPDAVAAWVGALSPEHAHLRPLLENLLLRESPVSTGDFLGELPQFTSTGIFQPGAGVGRYRLVRPLGRGGMGEVWLAVRNDGTFERPTALKLPHAHLLSGALRQRFEREREILATLAHPNIAALYDAGVSDDGHPYLAMEWVDGTPITAYCGDAHLPFEARLDLLCQVLGAIAHAHSRFIAHRDLKPSNILVAREGEVKLLDFGIAKLLAGEAGALETELTQLGGRAVTPDYAAPEQLAGHAITTRVDIYALGVVLFELLTGRRPARTPGAPPASRSADDAHAALMELTPDLLRRRLQGDLDAILAKALEVDPNERYQSAEAFADDLRRHRRHAPISARRLGRLSLTAKFIRRHRLPAALTAGLVAAMIAGTVGVGVEAVHANRAAVRAEQEANRATATKEFLVNVFKASDPRIASDRPGGSITAKELLDVSAGRIERQFSGDPRTEIELLGLTSEIYAEWDDTARSGQLLQKQIDLARRLEGDDSRTVIRAMLRQAIYANVRSDYAEAQKLLGDIDARINRAGLNESVDRALWWQTKSAALISDHSTEEQMVEALQHSVELFARYGPLDHYYPPALSDLANVYLGRHEFARAVEYNRRAVAALESQPSGDEGDLAQLYGNLGITLTYDGKLDAAARAYARAVDLARSTYGEASRSYWVPAARYAEVVHLRGDYLKADELFDKLMSGLPAAATPLSPLDRHELAIVRETYGARLVAEGRPAPAIALLETAVKDFESSQGYFYESMHARAVLGQAYGDAGQVDAARKALTASLEQRMSALPPGHPSTLRAREEWARFLLEHGDVDEAARQFEAVLKAAAGSTEAFVAFAHAGVARVALLRDDLPRALQASLQASQALSRTTGFRDVRMGPYVARVRAAVLLRSGDAKEASRLAEGALEELRRYDFPTSPEIAAASATLRAARQEFAAR